MAISRDSRRLVRSRGSSRLIGVLAATSALCALAVPAAAPSSGASLAVPRLTWQDCGDGFECTTAHVPLDYDKPAGRAIGLALIRLAGNRSGPSDRVAVRQPGRAR